MGSRDACRPPRTATVRQDERDWTCPHGVSWRWIDSTLGWHRRNPAPGEHARRRRVATRIAMPIGYALALPVWLLTRRDAGRTLGFFALFAALIEGLLGAPWSQVGLLVGLGSFALSVQILRRLDDAARRRAEPEPPALPPGVPPASYARLNIRMRLRDVPAFVRVPYVLIQSEGATRPDYEPVEILSWHVEHDEKETL